MVDITLKQLNEPAIPAKTKLLGEGSFTVGAGKKLKVKAGEEVLINEQVPAGKQWNGWIQLKIEQADL